jgi:chorismate lyase/3-hydroxybenzoate synthase
VWRCRRSVSSGPLKIEVHYAEAVPPAADGVLAVVRFDPSAALATDSLTIDVRLAKLRGPAVELWRATGAVRRGRSGIVRHASDDHCLFAVAETDEREHGGIAAASEFVYGEILGLQNGCGFPQLLRMWIYFDAINEGDGDEERYRIRGR